MVIIKVSFNKKEKASSLINVGNWISGTIVLLEGYFSAVVYFNSVTHSGSPVGITSQRHGFTTVTHCYHDH